MKNKTKLFRELQSIVCVLVMLFVSNAWSGAPPVCPDKSAGDHPFNLRNISDCVWINNDNNKLPVSNQTVDYNIYCPGRMTQRQANSVGLQIVNGERIREGYKTTLVNPNIIVRQHRNRGLKPVYISTPHRFHYGCVIGGHNGVATHIKVRVKAHRSTAAAEYHAKARAKKIRTLRITQVANQCRFHGGQNGGIALGARMDREYKCLNMIGANERDIAKAVAVVLVKRDMSSAIRRMGGKACVLTSTDIQCAPCSKSDKLIVRIKTVGITKSCPAGQAYGIVR